MKTKTYKREVASVMLVCLAGLFGWGVYSPQAMQAAEFLTFPIFTFAGGAFALDTAVKQGKYGKPDL
jgi:hypothetical protein